MAFNALAWLLLLALSAVTPGELIVEVLPGSTVELAGKSNVGAFRCTATVAPRSMPVRLAVQDEARTYALESAHLTLPTAALDCGSRLMERDLRQALRSERYPDIGVRVEGLRFRENGTVLVEAVVSVAGCQRDERFTVGVKRWADGCYLVAGALPIEMLEYGIAPPTALLGLVRVDGRIEIAFDLVVRVGR